MSKATSLSRRSFLKMAAMTAAAAAVGTSGTEAALAETYAGTINPGDLVPAEGDVKRIRTACRGCGKFECGVFVTVENGRAVKVEGDDSYTGSMGNCCAKSQASLQAAYHPARLKYPMMRTNPKGENPGWKRITWDEALHTIDEKMSEIEEKYGSSANCFFGGTSRIYAMGFTALSTLYNSQMSISPGQVCKGPRTTMTRQTSISEMNFCENSWRPNLWIQWGSGIEVSNYDDAGRVAVDNASHADCYINIDARMSNLAKEAAGRPGSFFLAPRPGTDGAIALCWIKEIIDRELYDAWYVKRWTNCAFLVAEDMEPTPFGAAAVQQGITGAALANTDATTVLLKESDVDPSILPWEIGEEGPSAQRFLVWDAANDRLTYLDAATGLWEGEGPFKMKYVEGSEWYMQAAKWNRLFVEQEQSLWDIHEWEEVKGQYVTSARDGLTAFLPDQDDMPTVEGCEYPTDPSLYSDDVPEILLADGSTVTVKTVFELLYANAEEFTPEHTEEVTNVKADLLRECFDAAFAKRYDPQAGVYQGSINYAVTHEHTGNAIAVLHPIEVLDVLRGVMDTPGGHRAATRAASVNVDQSTNIIGQYLRNGDYKADKSRQMPYYDTNVKFGMKGDADATSCFRSIAEGIPFQTHGAMAEAGQVLNQSNISEAFEAMKNLDFFVDANLWEDPISSLADILLPEQHWMEVPFATRCTQGSNGFYGAHIRCIEPLGESRFGNDWICELYKIHGTPFWERADDGDPWEWEDYLMNRAVQSTGMTWQEYVQEFLENGWIDARKANPNGWGCYRRFITGWNSMGKPGYATNTTRHEVWVTNFETKMRHNIELATGKEYGTKYALPFYAEPKSSPNGGGGYVEVQGNNPDNPNHEKIAGYTVDKYPYILSTGRRIPVYFHSEHRQLPWCREVWPVPRLEVNPIDAAELGLENGDWAWIETPFGKIRQCVDVNSCVKPGQMNAEHSWWFPELDQPGHGFDLCGCNCLVDSWAQCEAYGAPQLRGYLANVYKATPENSPFNNPVPCGVDGTPIITDSDDPRLKEWQPTYEGRE